MTSPPDRASDEPGGDAGAPSVAPLPGETVEEVRARLAAIVESSQDAIVSKTLTGIVTSWNRGAERLFGYRAEEMIGRSIGIIIPPDRAADMTAILTAIGRGERVEHFESERVRKDGTRINVSLTVSPIRDAQGRIIGASKVARDITARRRAERERQRTLRELSTLYAVGQAVAAELDRERVLQRITDAATDLSGASVGAFFSNPDRRGDAAAPWSTRSGVAPELFDVFGVPHDAGLITAIFDGGAVLRVADLRALPRAEPAPFPVASFLAVPVTNRSGEVLGGLFLGHPDPGVFTAEAERVVTALAAQAAIALENARLYEVEQRARVAAEEASRAKDQFLAMLGHELRNPLAALQNGLTVARHDAVRAPRALAIARHGAQQLARLVDDLLDVTRVSQGRLALRRAPLALGPVLERAVELARPLFEERGVALALTLDGPACHVDGDAARLEQVIGNLLTNAAKYTEAGGQVSVALANEDGAAVVRVRDTGIGIAPELLARIFDVFVQAEQALDRARGGLGIGLTLVRQLVELHGGRVEAHSDGPGRGAEFLLRLPTVAAPPAAAAAPVPAAAVPLHARVLIVEDNADAAESLQLLLEMQGLRADTAADGPAALCAAGARRPDVMLVDIGLPGMNGYELAAQVRADPTLCGVTLVALTGYGQGEDRQRAMAAGFDHHLVKPVDLDALQRVLAGAVPPRA